MALATARPAVVGSVVAAADLTAGLSSGVSYRRAGVKGAEPPAAACCMPSRSRAAAASAVLEASRAHRAASIPPPRVSAEPAVSSSSAVETDDASASSSVLDSIPAALEEVAAGRFVVVVDDEDRENEGDLIMAADKVTAQSMAWMIRHTSGLVCIAMEGERLDELNLPPMVDDKANNESMYTAFTVSCDHISNSTGISAADRATTVLQLANSTSTAEEFRRPGHMFPLRYREGGVLTRPGHTEAAVDLARLAGCTPAGILCELVNDDGSMMRLPQLQAFANEHKLALISIKDLCRFRQALQSRQEELPAR